VLIDSVPESAVRNSQPAGIGRIAALGRGCAWNNLGRNVVFADKSLRPRAVFGETEFPADDETSQFDLDVHAIVEMAGTDRVAVLNHLGIARIFEPWALSGVAPSSMPSLVPLARLDFVADVERIAALGDRLVTSRPRGDRLGGVLVTAPIADADHRLEASTAQESFGFVTALTARSNIDATGWVALGGENRVRLVTADRGRLDSIRWEAEIDFLATVIVVSGPTLWVAGSASGGTTVEDYDWEQLKGGGLVQLDLASGEVIQSARLGCDLAWGSGAVPLVVADGAPYGVGRHGELYLFSPQASASTSVVEPITTHSLGIAHAAVVGDQIVYGFNRGGYQLHTSPTQTINRPGCRHPSPGRP
jgi:hypothetical protein